MARKRERKTLETGSEGLDIEVQQLDAMRGLRLSHKLVRAIGPALARIAAGSPGGLKLSEMKVDGLAEGLELFFAHFSADDLQSLLDEVLGESLVTHQGQTGPYPLFVRKGVFDGRIDLLLKALLFGLELNFGPLFAPVRSALGKVGAATGSPSTSLPT